MKQASIAAALEGAGKYSDFAYFFSAAAYRRYRWSASGADPAEPMPLSAWNLPAGFAASGVDAALNGEGQYAGKAYFFDGASYVRYDWATGQVDEGFPQPLSAWNLPGDFARGIDAALNGRGDYAGKCFFFRGDQYVRYDWATGAVEADYPQPLSVWGLPDAFAGGIAAALNGVGPRDGKAFLFSRDAFCSFDWAKDAPDESGMMPLLLWGVPGAAEGDATAGGGATDEAAARERIVDAARAVLDEGAIHARKRDADGGRMGWERLRTIFADAAPAFLQSPGYEDRVLRGSTEVGRQGIPHWCGIFALWAARHGVPDAGQWVPGHGISSVRGVKPVPPAELRPGDIGFMDALQHHFVVAAVHGDGSIDSIDGNGGADSTVTFNARRKVSAVSGYYTVFRR